MFWFNSIELDFENTMGTFSECAIIQSGLNEVVLVGGKNILNSLQIIKDNNIPIILNRIHSLPSNHNF